MAQTKIAFLGNFGTRNLGNEYTLAAILENARKHLPDAVLTCICADPREAAARHGIPAVLLSYRYSREFLDRAQGASTHPLVRNVRRLLVRMPRELLELVRTYRALDGTRMLVMTGTGMLGDFGIRPLGLHYEILKWSLLAKARGAQVLFVSVGAGPLAEPLSRWIVKRALSLADYRSYRDAFSRDYLARIGFDASGDAVYPDLAFALPPPAREPSRSEGRVVGVGLMDYYGRESDPQAGQATYQKYLENAAALVTWLRDRGYTVHLLVGDLAYDRRIKRDLLALLERSGPGSGTGRVVDVPLASEEDLVRALAATDLVVATRFHNVVLALMQAKPVLALAYHEKSRALMRAMGLEAYSHPVDGWDGRALREQFGALERNAAAIAAHIRERTARWRRDLDEQFARIFHGLRDPGPAPARDPGAGRPRARKRPAVVER